MLTIYFRITCGSLKEVHFRGDEQRKWNFIDYFHLYFIFTDDCRDIAKHEGMKNKLKFYFKVEFVIYSGMSLEKF